jgi:hypothetical protein
MINKGTIIQSHNTTALIILLVVARSIAYNPKLPVCIHWTFRHTDIAITAKDPRSRIHQVSTITIIQSDKLEIKLRRS